MNNKPLVSYIVPTYNCEKFIEKAVESALSQTYENMQIIFSDDCSTDNTYEKTKELLANYQGPHKIKIYRNEVNLGITKHMNKLFLECAEGEYIVVSHGDDISYPERTSVLVEYLLNHEDCFQVGCSARGCNEKGEPLATEIQEKYGVKEERVYGFNEGGHVCIGFSAFRKVIMTEFGPLKDSCPTEDDAIGFRAIILGKIAFLPNVLIDYVKHSGCSSNPALFSRFPLDKILDQNITDLELAVQKGFISKESKDKKIKELKRVTKQRSLYREYYATHKFTKLMKFLFHPKVRVRSKYACIKEYFRWKKGIREQ